MNCNAGYNTYSKVKSVTTYPNNGNYAYIPGQATGFVEWGEVFPINHEMPESPVPIKSPQINITERKMIPAATPKCNLPEHLPEIPPCNLPETMPEYMSIPEYLRENIGNLMRVEFLIGHNTTDRVGILREVGASFIVLDPVDGCGKIMCDLFSIRFVTILQTAKNGAMPGCLKI